MPVLLQYGLCFFYAAHLLSIPKAPAIKKAGRRITAPPAKTRQSISTGKANAISTVAVIFAAPQVILKASLTAPKKNQSDKAVIKNSNIVFLLENNM